MDERIKRDPPQAENPVEQDSFLQNLREYRKNELHEQHV